MMPREVNLKTIYCEITCKNKPLVYCAKFMELLKERGFYAYMNIREVGGRTYWIFALDFSDKFNSQKEFYNWCITGPI